MMGFRGLGIYLRHLEVSKFIPQVLGCICADKSGAEKSDPFDAANAANVHTRQKEPSGPFSGKRLLPQVVEASPAKRRCEGEEEKH